MLAEPRLSPKFDMDDIRAFRDWNSARRIEMGFEKGKEETDEGANEFLRFLKRA